MRPLSTVLALAAVATLGASVACAQEVEATVTVNADHLSPAFRDEVGSFADDMKRYIDETRWTNTEWEGEKVKMNFNVVFMGGSGGELTAKLLVGSQRSIHKSTGMSPMMKVLDEDWTFPYTRNQPFQRDENRYDPLTGVIDFYVFTALGLDLDSYDYLGGSRMYAKAREIAQRASAFASGGPWSTQAPSGSYSRYGFIRELTDVRYYPLRKFILDYHYSGLDLLVADRTAALDSINTHLNGLVLAKNKLVEGSTILRVLNDAKHVEFSELFVRYPDESVWRKFEYLDPGHKTVYDAARAK